MRRTIARPLAGALVAGFMIALLPTAAWAAEGRIQEVQSQPGEVSFVLSAKGLAEGESIDAGSVKVRIGGQDAQATAQGLSQSAAAPTRTVMLVMDVSGSMNESGKLGTAKAAAHSYLDALPADVLVGLVTSLTRLSRRWRRPPIAPLSAPRSTASRPAGRPP